MPDHFNRPPRLQPPPLPDVTIDLPAPPIFPDPPDQNLLITLLPVVGIGVMALFYVLRSLDSQTSLFSAVPLLALALFTIGGTLWAQRWRLRDYHRRRLEAQRNYLRTLAHKRARLQAAHDAYRAVLEANFPTAEKGLQAALQRTDDLWGCRSGAPDFAIFRLGTGAVPLPVKLQVPDLDIENPLLAQVRALTDEYRLLEDAPVTLSLLEHHAIGVCGARPQALRLLRATLAHLARTHAPPDLHLHVIAPQTYYEDWRWLEWLPHTSGSHQGGAADLIAFTPEGVRNLLGSLAQIVDERQAAEAARIPHLLLVIDGATLAEGEAVYSMLLREGRHIGASVICITERWQDLPGECSAVVTAAPNGDFRCMLIGGTPQEISGEIDGLSPQDAEHLARALAAVTMRETTSRGRLPRYVDFLELYNARRAADLYQQIGERWSQPLVNGVLPRPVPIGRESFATVTEIMLDENHHGPHGVLAGTTGAGKSEFLQTLICALVLEHDPRLLNLLLIDFKGGSTFNGFARLPHTVGIITNLDGALIERALQALRSEIRERQAFLQRIDRRDVTQYHRAYARTYDHIRDASYQPLPHLFVIVDEFAQLAKEMPDFLRELVRIAQMGRSLGLHLILGTQSPMDVITDEMNANLQFRICFRVQNIEASRAMLRRPDAAYLPADWAGRAYFQVGERGMFKQFQTAYASADALTDEAAAFDTVVHGDHEPMVLELVTDHVIDLIPKPAPIFTDDPYTTAHAIVDTVIDYAQHHDIPFMPPLLLPPLETRLTLKTVFAQAGLHGWNGRGWRTQEVPIGSAPIGLVDEVTARRQYPLWVHLTADHHDSGSKNGHVMVIGAAGSGKTTLLQTLALSLALLHPPDALHLYFLSFTGGDLRDISGLPHAETLIQGTETERVRRLFRRLIHVLNERLSGRAEPAPLVLLCLDGYEQFRDTYYDAHLPEFERLIYEGRAAGIYVALTAGSINAVPERLRSAIQQRVALRLPSAADYTAAVGQLPGTLHPDLPKGRGYIYHAPPLLCQISLPGEYPVEDINGALRGLVGEIRAAYRSTSGSEQAPLPLHKLPAMIPLDGFSAPLVIGQCDDDALSHFVLPADSSWVAAGPPASGKSNLLRAAVLAAAAQTPPDALRFVLVDSSGRGLLPLTGLKHTAAYLTDPADLESVISALDNGTEARTVFVIDDYDLLTDAGTPLRRLRDLVRSQGNILVWAAGVLEHTGDPLLKHLLLKRTGFALLLRESLHPFNVRTTGLPHEVMPPGRGYFVRHHQLQVVQMAFVAQPEAVVQHINTYVWADANASRWGSSPTEITSPTDDLRIDTAGLIEDLLNPYDE